MSGQPQDVHVEQPPHPRHSHLHIPHHEEEVAVEVLTTKKLKPINDAHRFTLFSIGCFACIAASFGYAFNLISSDMQKLLGLSLRDLANINTVGTCLQYATFPYSIIYDYLGPIIPLCIGTTYFVVGAILLALAFRKTITPSVVRLCVFNGIMNAGLLLFDMCSNVTVTVHFPTTRGLIIPLLKSYVGLGSAIVGTIQLAFFTNAEYFFYFLAALAAAVAVFIGLFVKLPYYHMTGYQVKHLSEEEKADRTAYKAQYLRQDPAKWRFVYSFVVLGVLICFLPTQSAVLNYLKLGKNYKIGFAITTIILVFLLTLVSIPVPSDRKRELAGMEEQDEEEIAAEEREPANGLDELEMSEKAVAVSRRGANRPKETIVDYIAPQYQFTFWQSLLTLRYWAILWTLFCLAGAEFNVISYSSYIYGAIDGKPVDANLRTLLSVLNGVGSAVGRLLIALFEHLTQNRPPEKRIPLTWAPMLPSAFNTISLVLFLSLPGRALPLAFVIMAFANGSQAAMTALVPRTIYAKDLAQHYNFQFVSAIIGTIALVRFLFAEWYTRKAEANGNTGGYCFGKSCILMPFCVLLGLVVTSFGSNLYVCWRYWQFSNRVLAERARLREEAAAEEDRSSDMERMERIMENEKKAVGEEIEGNLDDPNERR